jgi:Metallo-beta-lactamase superfamily
MTTVTGDAGRKHRQLAARDKHPEEHAKDICQESTARPCVEPFFDESTSSVSYVVFDPVSARGAIVDSVRDFDAKSGHTAAVNADRILSFVQDHSLTVDWILETHVHADHLTAARYLRDRVGGRIGIGSRVTYVQRIFKDFFNLASEFRTDGSQFDHLFADGERLRIGVIQAEVLPHSGSHARLRHLSSGRRCFHWRYPLHAGLRNGTGRLPGRLRYGTLSLDPQDPLPTGGN